jgi:hypothetical protein
VFTSGNKRQGWAGTLLLLVVLVLIVVVLYVC